MGKSVRFIHAADLHIGAAMRGLRELTPEWAQRFQRATSQAFDRIIEAALLREVDFVVFAGDVFDASQPSYGDYLNFFEGLRKLDEAGISSYLVAGNHDPYTSWARDMEQLPPSAHLLGASGPQFALHEKAGEPLCLVAGRSYYNQTWPDDQNVVEGVSRAMAEAALHDAHPNANKAPFAIGIVHTGLDVDTAKAPAAECELMAAGIDYWACGHLHERRVLPSSSNPRIAFPGCIQAHDVKETGDRGCFFVEIQEGYAPQIEFVPTASIVIQQIEVHVGASQTLADLARLVQAEMFKENGAMHCDDMVVRIVLVGQTELHRFLCQADIVEELRKRINDAYPSFYCDVLIDHTTYPDSATVDSDSFLQLDEAEDRLVRDAAPSGPFSSIAGSMAEEQRGREDVMINYVQNEFVKRGVTVPTSLSQRVGDFTRAAEMLVMDLLQEEAE